MQRDYLSQPEDDEKPDIFDRADEKYETNKLKTMENQEKQAAAEQTESGQVEPNDPGTIAEQSLEQGSPGVATTTNELTVVIQQSGVEQSTALTLQNSFMPFFNQAKEWDKKAKSLVVTDASQTREMKMAREARLALRDIRIDADKKRKALKEDSLRYGKAVQGVYNVIDFLIAPIESHLKEQEDFVQIQEAKIKADLKDKRDAELQPYIEFVPYQVDLGELSEAAWQTVLNGAKLQKQAKVAAEIQAETDRIAALKAEADERERIRLENEQLKADAIERERKAAEELAEQKRLAEVARKKQEAELAKAEKARKELEEKNRVEQERLKEVARVAQVERDRLAKIEKDKADKLLADQKVKTEKLAAELKAKTDAEQAEVTRLAKIESDRVAAEKKAAKAPDKTKLTTWINGITLGQSGVTTPESQAVESDIIARFESFKKWALTQIETL